MSTIENYIKTGKLEQAIRLVPGNDGTLLMGRYNTMQRQHNMGLLSRSEYNMMTNRLIQAAMHHAGSVDEAQAITTISINQPRMDSAKHVLIQIRKKLAFSQSLEHKELKNRVTEARDKIVAYQNAKNANPDYDVSQVEREDILSEVNSVIKSAERPLRVFYEEQKSNIRKYLKEAEENLTLAKITTVVRALVAFDSKHNDLGQSLPPSDASEFELQAYAYQVMEVVERL